MSFRLVPKSVTWNDLERRNGLYYGRPMEYRAGHYIFALWFLLSSFYLFSSPILSRRRLDVYHTSTHGVALVRI